MLNKEEKVYRTFSGYMSEKYGSKVYKLPISLPLTCPNRDGCRGFGGCIYCSPNGGSFENLSNKLSVGEQIQRNKLYIEKKYNAKLFIAYFQSFSNTYMDPEDFRVYMEQTLQSGVVEIYISTRPDCLNDDILALLFEYNSKIPITVELGLQSVNDKTLKILNRGHDLATFINAVQLLHDIDVRVCAHMILDLPWDEDDDIFSAARILSSLNVDEIKLHSLYIVKNTELYRLYVEGKVKLLSEMDYKRRFYIFLRNIKSDIVFQRIIGRAPKEDSCICNWSKSWWKIRDEIVEYAIDNNITQGDLFKEFNIPLNK